MIPLFGVFFGWLIRNERLGIAEVAGGVLIIGGVYLLVTANTRQATAAPKP
jgi:drug/metabolite transporter (DMT)-like permease